MRISEKRVELFMDILFIIYVMYIKYTLLEWKWVREFTFDIKFTKNDDFEKNEKKKHFYGKRKSWKSYKN